MSNEMFNSALESLHQFCIEMDADWCMVYDFMEAQVGTLTEDQWDEVEMVYHNYNMDSRYWLMSTVIIGSLIILWFFTK